MNTNIDRKRKYVQITGQILESEGIKGVNIRRIAKEAGCTSAVLYKHFDNLEHLIILASVHFLEPYIREFRRITKRTDITSIQMDLYLWKFFIREAFINKPYYEMMFFGPDRDMLEDYIYEYYSLFPEMEKDFDGFSASIIFSNNLAEREYIRLRRAAHGGLITMDNARLLMVLILVLNLTNYDAFIGLIDACTGWIMDHFTGGFCLLAFLSVVLIVVTYFSPMGRVKIGGADSKPMVSYKNYVWIVLCTIMAAGPGRRSPGPWIPCFWNGR